MAVVLGGALWACGGGGGGSSFNPQSVPGDKPIEELDPVEQEEFCEEAIEWADEFLADTLPRLLCRTEGISAGGTEQGFDAAACRAAEQACLKMGSEFDDAGPEDLTCNVDAAGEHCDATVDDFAACFSEAANLSRRFLAELTCDSIAGGATPDEADFQVSPRCQGLFERCGGEAEDDTEDDVDGGTDTGTAPPPPG